MFAQVRKIGLVVIITALIWVWADQALTRTLDNIPATVHVDKTTDPKLWVSFNKQSTFPIKIKFSGPARKIDSVEKKLRETGSLAFDFYFKPLQETMTEPGKKYSLPLLPLVQQSTMVQDLGLQVESTSPESVDVEVVKLVNRRLTVQVLSDNQVPLTDAIVEPAAVEMLVREDYIGSALRATVIFGQQEIEQARISKVARKPVVELAAGVTKVADTMVSISLPSAQNRLKDYTIDETNIGYALSPNKTGLYKVELVNRDTIIAPLKFRATPDAKAAFDSVPFKLRLDVTDEDTQQSGEISRPVAVNFPDEYVKKGEIVINETDRIAKFKILAVAPSTADHPAEPPATELK